MRSYQRRKQVATIIAASTNADVNAAIPVIAEACAAQLLRHVAPAWRQQAILVLAASEPIPNTFSVLVTDNADIAGALGYHDQGPDGLPYARVFVEPILSHGGGITLGPNSVSTVVSHEVCELFGDPECNRWASDWQGRLYALELCDAVQALSYEIKVPDADGLLTSVAMSDFIFPEWFDPMPPPGHRFCQTGALTGPFSIAPGGYSIIAVEGRADYVFGDILPDPVMMATKASLAARTRLRFENLAEG